MAIQHPLWRSSLGAWWALAVLIVPTSAHANVGPPSSGGQLAAEPVGVVGVDITRETLTIDLRPLSANGLARVEAVYHLHNRGAEKKLDLLFASGSATVADFQVSLGGVPVASAPAAAAELPASWKAPKRTPGLHDEQGLGYLDYQSWRATPVAFAVTVPPGEHDLRVRYAADAATHFFGYPTVYRQFAYVLAPARAWSAFGGLDVTIHLPENWHAACTPELTREGDALKGSFAGLPADAIALTVQAPAGWAFRLLRYVSLGLLGSAGFGGPWCARGLAGPRAGASPSGPGRGRTGSTDTPGRGRSGWVWPGARRSWRRDSWPPPARTGRCPPVRRTTTAMGSYSPRSACYCWASWPYRWVSSSPK